MEPPSSPAHIPMQDMDAPEKILPFQAVFSDEQNEGPEILVRDRRWRSYVHNPEQLVWRALAACSEYGGLPDTVVLATDREVRELNGRHRGKHRPTNVLTFEPPPALLVETLFWRWKPWCAKPAKPANLLQTILRIWSSTAACIWLGMTTTTPVKRVKWKCWNPACYHGSGFPTPGSPDHERKRFCIRQAGNQ